MSRTVSFRCSEELDEFLEEEAERRMTTKSTVAQMMVAQAARDISNDSATSNTPVTPPETGEKPDSEKTKVKKEDLSKGPVGEVTEIDLGSKEEADGIREMFGEWLDESDDKRLTRVRFKKDTPVEVVEAVEE